MPARLPRASATAWPMTMPVSSVVRWKSIWRSPFASTSRSIRLWRRRRLRALCEDGQVRFGNTVIKSNARKGRRLGKSDVIAGFAGATADAFALFERLEAKLEQHPGQLSRACVELAKDWRTDRYLRRLEAMMAVADQQGSLVLTRAGDVLEAQEERD